MQVMKLNPGDVVRAAKDLDPDGANVKKGDVGVVFLGAFDQPEVQADGSKDFPYGPMIRWVRTEDIECKLCHGRPETRFVGVCNVYEGDVEIVSQNNESRN